VMEESIHRVKLVKSPLTSEPMPNPDSATLP
jgi:hypothetical protein